MILHKTVSIKFNPSRGEADRRKSGSGGVQREGRGDKNWLFIRQNSSAFLKARLVICLGCLD